MTKLLACALAAASVLGGQTVVTYRSTVDRIGAALCAVRPEVLRPRAPLPGGGEPARGRVEPCGQPQAGLRHSAALRRDRTAGFEPSCRCCGRWTTWWPARLRRGTMGYQGIAEQDVYDVLADVKRRYSVDDDRAVSHGSVDGRRRGALAGADAPGRVGGGGAGVRRCVSRHGGPGSQRAQSAGALVSTATWIPRCAWSLRASGSGACSRWRARWSTSNFPAYATMPGTSPTKTAACSTGSPNTGATPIRTMSAW